MWAQVDAMLARVMSMVTARGDREIVMSRIFAAPRGLVFDALTTPDLLKRWLLGSPGWTMTVCTIEPKAGGAYRYVWRHADGTVMGARGVCLEVLPLERIVATERLDRPWYPGEALLTETLVERQRRTTLTLTIRYESRAIRDRVLATSMANGLWTTYDRLEQVLADGQRQGWGGIE